MATGVQMNGPDGVATPQFTFELFQPRRNSLTLSDGGTCLLPDNVRFEDIARVIGHETDMNLVLIVLKTNIACVVKRDSGDIVRSLLMVEDKPETKD